MTLNTGSIDLSVSEKEKDKLEAIKQTLQEIEQKAELVDIVLPDISGRLDSQQIQVSDRLKDALNVAQELKDLQSKLLSQTLTLNTENSGLTVPPKEKAKLEAIKKTLQEIEQKAEQINVVLPSNLSKKDFGNNLQNIKDTDLTNNLVQTEYTQNIKEQITQLEQNLEQALQDVNKIKDFRDRVLEKVSNLEVEIFSDLLNKIEYAKEIKQELNQLEQKLEQALQDLKKIKDFRDRVLEKALELEIELFSDLLKEEIQLLQEFNQRIEDGFSKIYDETLMVLDDLQKFRNAINSSDPSPSNLDLVGDLSLDYDQGTYDFALSYHFGDQRVPYNPEKKSSATFPLFWFEPIAGIRLNDFYVGIDADISYDYEGESINVNGNFRESFIDKRTWFEPMVGAKIGLQVSPPITLWLRGDVSGFGLAGETNLAWNFISGMDWWVSPSTSILLAYRFYEFSYGNGSGSNENLLDINFNGPLIGVTYNF